MNRADLQKLPRIRLREAKILLDNGCYEGAYYLAGYAVECALKACITKQIQKYDFPEKKLVNDIYTHNLNRLMELAGLKSDYDGRKADTEFENNWTTVKDWDEGKRYEYGMTAAKAKDYYLAVVNRQNGIMPWIRKWW
jgi:HEPN domain-containing protein